MVRALPVALAASLLFGALAAIPVAQADCHYSHRGCWAEFDPPPLGCFLVPCHWRGDSTVTIANLVSHTPGWGGLALNVKATPLAGSGSNFLPGETHNSARNAGRIDFRLSGDKLPEGYEVVISVADTPFTFTTERSQTHIVAPGLSAEPRFAYTVPTLSGSHRAERIVHATDTSPNGRSCQSALTLQPGTPVCVVATYYGRWVDVPFTMTARPVADIGASEEEAAGIFRVFVETLAMPLQQPVPWDAYQRLHPVELAMPGVRFVDDPNLVWDPHDTAYLDLDNSRTVSVGDQRLTGPMRGKVLATDPDVTVHLTPATFGFCHADLDADGAFDSDEPLYYGPCGDRLAPGDVRIANTVLPFASQVRRTDADLGLAVRPVTQDLRYFDADGNSRLNVGDTLYLHGGSGLIRVGDVILNGPEAGKTVAAGSPALNSPLLRLNASGAYFDADADGDYFVSDIPYMDFDGSRTATVNDLRLGAYGSLAAGRLVGSTDLDTTFRLRAAPHAAFCFLDTNGDAQRQADEGVYWQSACGPTQVGALRMQASGGRPAGSMVAGGDADFALPTSLVVAVLCFHDADGDGGPSIGESVFLHFNGGCTVSTSGDIRLSGHYGAVAPGEPGLPLTAMPGVVRSFDADGDGAFGPMDGLYLDADDSSTPTVNDVRLTNLRTMPPGRSVEPGDLDLAHDLLDAPHVAICRSMGAVYLQTKVCGPLEPLAIRLTPTTHHEAGTVVLASDQDIGAATTPLRAQYCFVDTDGNGRLSAPDAIYVNVGDVCDFVSADDIALSAPGPAPPPPPSPTPTRTTSPETTTRAPFTALGFLLAALLALAWRRRDI
jgi:hypothetical protein